MPMDLKAFIPSLLSNVCAPQAQRISSDRYRVEAVALDRPTILRVHRGL